ncbi:MAG: amidohydrolase family protein [Candidatus Entotheonellia bacterium]
MSTYTLISSDSHIIEPPDLWEERIDARFRDRAPHLVHEEHADQWYADDVKFGNIGTNQQAGLRFEAPEQLTAAGRMATIPLGGIDPHAHVQDMDVDTVAGGVLYPSQGLTVFRVPDSELLSAIFRAYNDWLADFCRPYPQRLKGIAMLNVDDVEDAVQELQRAARLGLAGAMITLRPMEHRYDHPMYERLWAAAQDLEMPFSLHVGTRRWRPVADAKDPGTDAVEMTNREYDVRTAIGAMIFGGVFERYPRLRVGAVEFEVAWAPYCMGRMDNVYTERAVGVRGQRFKGGALPSDFFRRNIFISFQEDDLGIQLRSLIGVENLLWGSDYPHAESTFPKSREIVDRILRGVPEEEKAKIAGGNAARLYRFN